MESACRRFGAAFASHSDRTALIDATTDPSGPRRLTYGGLLTAAAGLAELLRAHGAGRGDRIGLMLGNGLELAVLYMAGLYGGITVVPVNPALSDADIRYIVEASRLTLLLVDAATRARLPERCDVPIWDIGAETDLLGRSTAAAPAGARLEPQERAIFSITFTSGTTSRPKGVFHRVGTLLGNALAFNDMVGLGADARMLHVMPMTYMAGFLNTLLSPLGAGGTVVLGPQFDASGPMRFWPPVFEHRPTPAWMTPTMLAALLRLDRNERGWREARDFMGGFLVGTAPLPAQLKRDFEARYGIGTLESYGMSEVLLVSGNVFGKPQRPGATGPLLPGVTMQARDGSGAALPPGQEGELWISTPYALVGYLDPQTGQPLEQLESMFETGDIGYVDADGYLFITARKKDLIIRGGMNVSPRAVEELLLTVPGTDDAAVIGMPHPFYGEEVVAVVVPKPGTDTSALQASLRDACRGSLMKEAVPTRFILADNLPRAVTGKISKVDLRARLIADGKPDAKP